MDAGNYFTVNSSSKERNQNITPKTATAIILLLSTGSLYVWGPSEQDYSNFLLIVFGKLDPKKG